MNDTIQGGRPSRAQWGSRTVLVCALVFVVTPAAAQSLLTLDNGAIRIGVDTTKGGSIVLLQRSGTAGTNGNVINSYDLGREVQQSYYSGPSDFQPDGTTQNPNWSPWGWNPVQAGDAYGNASRVVASSTTGGVLYTKTIPKQWALQNVDSECTMEQWITISGSVATVRNRLTNARSDTTSYAAFTQELPAMYTRGTLTQLKTYAGTQPFTGGSITTMPNTPPPSWGSFRGTEGWAAYVDATDWGLGVVLPGNVSFKGGFFTSGTATLPTSPSTGYIAPLRSEILDHDIVYDYTYHLVLGTVADIRGFAIANKPDLNPDYQFQGTRAGWTYKGGVSDAGFPIGDRLALTITGSDPQMYGPETTFQAAAVPKLYVRAAYALTSGTAATAQLFWERNNGASPISATNSKTLSVVNDGQYRIYEIDVSSTSSWAGQISRLRFDPVTSAGTGSSIDVQFISASYPTTITIDVASGTQTQVEARNAFLTGTFGIVKTGTGTLTLTTSNTFTGDTQVAAGGLRLGHAAALVNSTLDTLSGTAGSLSFGTLVSATFGGLSGSNGLVLTNSATTPAAVSLTVGGNGRSTVFAGGLSGLGALMKTGTGTLTLSGSDSAIGGTLAVNGGRLVIAPGAAGRFLASGKLQMAAGSGTTAALEILSGSNTLSSAGIGAIGDASGTSTLDIKGGTTALSMSSARMLVGNKGVGAINLSSGALTLSGSNDLVVGGDTQFAANNASGTITVTGGTLSITGSGALRMGVNVTGTVGVTTGARGTVNLDGGVFETARSFTIGTGSGTMNFNGGTLRALASSTNFIAVTAARVGPGGVVLDTGAHAVSITRPLVTSGSGSGGLTKLGAGSLTLTGSNTYTGPTLVSAGTLAIFGNQSAATGAVTVASGAALGGTGTVGGATTIQSGATLSPGASPGTLTFTQGLTWNGGGTYNWQVLDAAGTAGTSGGWDLASVAGTLTIASTAADPFKINLWSLSGISPDVSGSAANFDPTRSATWRIANATGGITGFSADKFRITTGATNGTGGFANDTARGTFSLALSGSTGLDLVFTPVTTLTWHGDGVNPGGSGAWTTTGTNWFNGQDMGRWVPQATAVFSGTVGTVTVGGGVTVGAGMQFTTPGYAVSVASGTLVLASGSVAGSPALAVSAGGLVSLPADRRELLNLAALAVDQATGGKLDIGAGRITVAPGGIAEADLRADLIAGRGTGSFSGTSGIMTTGPKASAGSTNPVVGYRVLASGTAIVAWAAAGDANLDGVVNSSDVTLINTARLYGKGNVGAAWSQGDFTYSGSVNSSDVQAMLSAQLYGKGSYLPVAPGGMPAMALATGGTGSGLLWSDAGLEGNALPAFAAVPEPGGLVLAGMGIVAAAWAARRHRNT
ncbi:MAG: beta strand repeat-containing protein [Planctomycetia bacterium]